MDRLDYVSMMCNEHAYVLAIEKLLGIEVPVRAQYIRVMFDEITRILNHLMWLGAHGARHRRDDGVPLLLPRARGPDGRATRRCRARACTRPTTARAASTATCRTRMPQYQRIAVAQGREARSASTRAREGSLLDFIEDFTQRFPERVDEYETLLTDNRIWKQRTVGIGVVTPERAHGSSASPGPMLRGSGIAWDLRKKQPYEVYDEMDFDIPVGVNGDCYDRYLVRVEEMRQSNRIIKQCVDWLRANPGPVMLDNHKVAPPSREEMKDDMEALIHHFKLFTEGYCVPAGETYAAVEAPEGRVRRLPGLRRRQQAVSACKCRAPGFAHLSALDEMVARPHARRRRRDDRHARHRVRRDRPMKATGNFEAARNVDPMVVLSDDTRAHIDHWVAQVPAGPQALGGAAGPARGAGTERRLADATS